MGSKARYRKLRLAGDGPIPWPPRPADGRGPTFPSTREVWADVLWTIAHAGSAIVSEQGLATAALHEQLAEPDRVNRIALTHRVNELVDLGLVDLDRRGKRTYAIGLAIAPARLTMRDPHDDRHGARRPQVPAPVSVVVPQQPEVEPPPVDVAQQQLSSLLDDDAARVAACLLRQVLSQLASSTDAELAHAPIRAERDHLARQLDRERSAARAATSELDRLRGRVKSLQVDVAESERRREQTASSLSNVLDGVRAYQQRFGLVSDERDQLDRIMRQAPGSSER